MIWLLNAALAVVDYVLLRSLERGTVVAILLIWLVAMAPALVAAWDNFRKRAR